MDMIYIGLVRIAAISHMKVLTTTEKSICLISALTVVKKWNIMNNINENYLPSFLLDKFIIDC